MIRFYLVPIERTPDGAWRGPKYFDWRFDPDPPGLPDRWNMIDYGLIDQAVLASDISDASHAALLTHADVYAFPLDLETTMPQPDQTALLAFLETYRIPGQWLGGQQTYRSVLRTITGMFLYIQRVSTLLNADPTTLPGVTFNTQLRNLPAALQAALLQAAADLHYDGYVLDDNTTLRNALKLMSDQWGDRTIYLGLTTL